MWKSKHSCGMMSHPFITLLFGAFAAIGMIGVFTVLKKKGACLCKKAEKLGGDCVEACKDFCGDLCREEQKDPAHQDAAHACDDYGDCGDNCNCGGDCNCDAEDTPDIPAY